MANLNLLSISTQGIYPNFTPYGVAVQGWNVNVEESIVEVPIPPSIGHGQILPNRQYHKRKKKKISVKLEKDGKIFTKDKFYSNLKVTAKDVKISIIEKKDKPKIKITLIK